MKELKLLYSYEEWKNKGGSMQCKSENTANMLMLAFKMDRTPEEEKKYQLLCEKSKEDDLNTEYTELTYNIIGLYNSLKYIHDDERRKEIYENIGRKQCEIEILKEKSHEKD